MNSPPMKGLTLSMKSSKKPITFYIDMDGTLAEYRIVDIKALYEPMYFRNLKPNENVIGGIKNLISKHPEISFRVLSCILEDRPDAVLEKTDWLKGFCPFLLKEKPCFIPCGTSKGLIASDGINVLLDDHSPNLIEFTKKSNCYGIKLLNGINGKGRKWQGAAISKDLHPNDFADSLYNFINGL